MANDDRSTIRRRRARLVAAALPSASAACSPQSNPFVCLSVMPADAGLPAPSPSTSGPKAAADAQTLTGIAKNGKAGAAVVVDDAPVYVNGLDEWPKDLDGKRVEVTGRVVNKRGLPMTPPPKEAGIVGPYRVIEGATWKLAK